MHLISDLIRARERPITVEIRPVAGTLSRGLNTRVQSLNYSEAKTMPKNEFTKRMTELKCKLRISWVQQQRQQQQQQQQRQRQQQQQNLYHNPSRRHRHREKMTSTKV